MDRSIVYPGSIPLDTDLLSTNKNAMVALGYLAQAVLGSSPVVDGLLWSPTSPPSLSVNIGPGSITQLTSVDPGAYGSLGADAVSPLLKMGVNLAPTSFTLTAPSSAGQSINYLIEATFLESDIDPIVLPYYNAVNPSQAFSGPNNAGTAQNTLRAQRVQLQLKAGTAALTGSQLTPPADSGWIGLYQITVNYGQTSVASANVVVLPTAPFLTWKLPNVSPGFGAGVQSFSSSGQFNVPAGITRIEVELWGGGSGSYASTSSAASGGGSGGGYARKRITGLTPGQVLSVLVGAGGPAGLVGGATLPTPGQTSSISNPGNGALYVQATGGSLNPSASASSPQNGAVPGGTGIGGDVNLTGSSGQIAFQGVGGMGGGAPFGGMQTSGTTGNQGVGPGGGASGAGTGANASSAYNGGAGAPGLVVIRW
jgi:hypothetical protein